jgi:DNA-binding NarL/FixJ family response regulator
MHILFADDHKMFADAAVALIYQAHPQARIDVVGDYQELSVQIRQNPDYDVVICDLHMPGGRQRHAIAQIRSVCESALIILITGSADPGEIGNAFAQGADAFVHKTQSATELVRIVEQFAARRQHSPDEDLADCSSSLSNPLSRRERETLRLVATGKQTKEIAQSMQIAPTTVKVYIRSLLKKTGSKTRTELAVFAIEKGYRP